MKGKSNPRREELKALSMQLRPLVKAGVYDSVNAGLRAIYAQETGASEWRTFNEWRKLGRPVKKGERGFPVWAMPRRLKAEGAGGDLAAVAALNGIEPQGAEWFPVAYIFHAGQVESATASSEETTADAGRFVFGGFINNPAVAS